MRFSESKEAVAAGFIEPDQSLAEKSEPVAGNSKNSIRNTEKNISAYLESPTISNIPTKADGTADLRYNESKEAVATGIIEPDQVLTEETNTSSANDTNEVGGNSETQRSGHR